MTILDFLRANPGKHTAETIADAISYPVENTRCVLTYYVYFNEIIGHEQHGKIVYEYKELNL